MGLKSRHTALRLAAPRAALLLGLAFIALWSQSSEAKRHDAAAQEFTRIVAQLERGSLPLGFDQWGLSHHAGWTVAHRAAQKRLLPAGFDEWHLANNAGWTVAHTAVTHGPLPDDFSQWGLADHEGATVAHTAVWVGRLPASFDQWELAGLGGWTVAHMAAGRGELPAHLPPTVWHLVDSRGVSVWSVAKKRGLVSDDPPTR